MVLLLSLLCLVVLGGWIIHSVRPPDIIDTTPFDHDPLPTGQSGDSETVEPTEISVDITDRNEQIGDTIDLQNTAERKEGFYTFLLCCTDEDKTRTDAIILLSLDTNTNKLNMLNIPRDTYSLSKRALKKINGAYSVGGINQLKKELKSLLGIPVDRYAVFDFDGVAELVDVLGGVTYEIPFRMKYDDPTQNLHIDFQPGEQFLDGEDAVKFLRWRKNNSGIRGGYEDGDLGRIQAQQQFMVFLAKRVLVPTNILNIPELAGSFKDNTQTDFSTGEIVWLGLKASHINTSDIEKHVLPGFAAMIYESGVSMEQSYFFPYRRQTLDLINEKFNPYKEDIEEINVVNYNQFVRYDSDEGE